MSDDRDVEISVVIVTYENELEIGRCLESLFRELTAASFQIIVVDNASGDQTRQVVCKYVCQQQGASVQLIANNVNTGFTVALNQGLRCSTGDKVLVLNPDTILLEGSLSKLSAAVVKQAGAVVAPQLLNRDGSIQPSCRRFPRRRDVLFEGFGLSRIFGKSKTLNHWKMGDFRHDQSRAVEQPQGACLLFRREVLEGVGFWDEQFPMFFSDVDWCKRVKQAGYEIRFQPEAQVVHDQGVSIERNRAQMILSSHRSFYRYFRKYYRGIMNDVLNYSIGFVLFVSGFFRALLAVLSRATMKGKIRRSHGK